MTFVEKYTLSSSVAVNTRVDTCFVHVYNLRRRLEISEYGPDFCEAGVNSGCANPRPNCLATEGDFNTNQVLVSFLMPPITRKVLAFNPLQLPRSATKFGGIFQHRSGSCTILLCLSRQNPQTWSSSAIVRALFGAYRSAGRGGAGLEALWASALCR